MSKEMSVIILGLFAAILPYIGIPGSWRMPLLVLTGIAIAVLGFLLRSEALSRTRGSQHHPFVENLPAGQEGDSSSDVAYLQHEQKEGITSLN